MTIATATEAQVRTLYARTKEVSNILQEYVQGSANGAKGTLSRKTTTEIQTLLTALEAASAAVRT